MCRNGVGIGKTRNITAIVLQLIPRVRIAGFIALPVVALGLWALRFPIAFVTATDISPGEGCFISAFVFADRTCKD